MEARLRVWVRVRVRVRGRGRGRLCILHAAAEEADDVVVPG